MSTVGLQRAILAPKELDENALPRPGSQTTLVLTDGTLVDSQEGGVNPNLRFEFASCRDLAAFLEDHSRIRLIDICFTDPLGRWHHCTFTTEHVDEASLEAGFGFDASSIPLFERIDKSDYVMKPDPRTCWLDPFATFPTLHITASIYEPGGKPYEKCPRSMLARTFQLLERTGIADEVYFGPEAEFFLFDSVRYSCSPHHMEFQLDGDEAYWNSANRQNIAHRSELKKGYMSARPEDRATDVRSEILLTLEQLGIQSEKHHHEVAACQMEINVRASGVVKCADDLMVLKYIVKNICSRHNKTATFMPKPLANDNGSGMHCNQSLWKNGRNLFYDEKGSFHQLSELAFFYIGGLLKHCKAVLALACPTTNSYRRLVPDFEAPVHITYSAGNRSTAIRVPTFTNVKTKRIEFRSPDASSCPYLAFAAMILAGLDGIRNRIVPPPVGEGNLFDPMNLSAKSIAKSPASLGEALDELEKDYEFLTKDGVFSEQFILDFIVYKRREVSAMRCQPHPREFALYYGC
eukprot:Protomagalhaensia_sp_Gyna_25__1181@NODE_1584_length_1711_cov_257_781100_g1290_i0_p1_GENE_NODE_1584_length_1711_cov_257_781100_g1290_i0NODE_1584_length_1711_cov_257_781100_g1290_i0_p1_ORF_typecomplete_len521_score84_73Glnsynt_C/PF00120_24/4_4e103Glnsynt_N/PF03951_19/2_9e15_NODE_1584_length_1711_cov_257_781100_g1290_i0861648